MRYMLDTNICVFALKHNPKVLEEFEAKRNDGIAISSITLAELEFGVCNSQAVQKNHNALIAFLSLVDVLSFDGTAAAEYGIINAALRKQGAPIGIMDTLIAAHAISEGLTVITNNTREFNRVSGLTIEDWSI